MCRHLKGCEKLSRSVYIGWESRHKNFSHPPWQAAKVDSDLFYSFTPETCTVVDMLTEKSQTAAHER